MFVLLLLLSLLLSSSSPPVARATVAASGNEDFSALASPSSFRGTFDGRGAVVFGDVSDSRCTVERLNEHTFRADDGLHYLLMQLAQRTFFRIFKVDLSKSCRFWGGDAAVCSQPDCSVFTCDEEQVPPCWRRPDPPASSESSANELLGNLDRSSGASSSLSFLPYPLEDREAWTAQDDDATSEYVDLQVNPERYTGYQGRAIWDAVYGENCFKRMGCGGGGGGDDDGEDGVPGVGDDGASGVGVFGSDSQAVVGVGACKEERVFYRIVSGLHASINIHISKQYLLPGGSWGANLAMYRERLHKHPERLRNLYFTYALVLRATSKAAPHLLHEIDYATGNATEDECTQGLVARLFESPLLKPSSPACEQTFDERDGVCPTRLNQFRAHFRNISTVMDCVGCEKCRLWGKLHFLGVGTALKILFSEAAAAAEEAGHDAATVPRLALKRNEVVALINVLKNLSHSMRAMHELEWALFEMHTRRHRWTRRGVAAVIALAVLGKSAHRVRAFRARIPPKRNDAVVGIDGETSRAAEAEKEKESESRKAL